MDEAVCFAEHVESMKSSVMSVGVSEVVEADGGKAHEDVASHGCRGTIPIDELRVGKLVSKGVRALRLKFAAN